MARVLQWIIKCVVDTLGRGLSAPVRVVLLTVLVVVAYLAGCATNADRLIIWGENCDRLTVEIQKDRMEATAPPAPVY